jgi:xylose isomerase
MSPRGDIFLATIGHVLAFISSLDPAIRDRPDSVEEVFDLVAGCMRSYLVLREKVQRFNADTEIQTMHRQLEVKDDALESLTASYTSDNASTLKGRSFDLDAMAERKLGYQRLDQLVFDLLTGAR